MERKPLKTEELEKMVIEKNIKIEELECRLRDSTIYCYDLTTAAKEYIGKLQGIKEVEGKLHRLLFEKKN
jgi:hypothetical protein